MKKLGLLILIACVLTSCYDPYRVDYDYTTVAFSTATGSSNESGVLGRTVVKGEGLHLDMGVYLGGVIENGDEHWAEYEIDPSLLNGTSFEMLPSDYYTLSDDNRFVIPAGENVGRVTVQLDSAKFVTDENATSLHYALPLRLTGTSADSILGTQSTKIVAIKYMNKYAGFYNQTGTFTTYDGSGNEINNGSFENVIEAETVFLDTVRTNGLINQRGADYQMEIATNSDNSVYLEYFPNPNPPTVSNLGPDSELATSYVSPWESLEAVNDGFASSSENPKYGNWNQGGSWQWIEYQFPNFFTVEESDVWWWTDGGGLQAATDSYLSYKPQGEENFVEIPNSKFGEAYDQYNNIEFNPVVTDVMRLNIIHDVQSVGVSEWRVFGLPAPVTPEQASIADLAVENGSSFNSENASFTLNYRVNFENGGYTVVESEMVWRNRIRDGVNEWRR